MRKPRDIAVDAESAQSRFERIQKIEGGLCTLPGIRFVVKSDAHLKVGRHGTMVELMDFIHSRSFRPRQPQQDENAWAAAEEIRPQAAQSVSILIRGLG